jgi:hypothetical protein
MDHPLLIPLLVALAMQSVSPDVLEFNASWVTKVSLGGFVPIGGQSAPLPFDSLSLADLFLDVIYLIGCKSHISYYSVYGDWLIHILLFTM